MADEPLTLNPADRRVEVETNTWLLSMGSADQGVLTVPEVVSAFHRTAARIHRRIRETGHSAVATFYVWHDEQAGQLRCSTASLPPEALPFGGLYVACDDLDAIVEGFLADGEPGFTPWSALEEVQEVQEVQDAEDAANLAEQAGTAPEIPLRVWVSSAG
ncbi:hypothetical protein OG444_01630 [Streptomyces sp. NBC_01232]|uniref:hypothetical protein n=1 Tax=unclassified Streptomyces TaxID=2593676 RepID=UPI002E11CC77|nr:hypothetical protein OG444_01630 [Streptomyces sp. NBC_01232]